MYKHPFYQIVESNRIEKSIRQRELNLIDFFIHESEYSKGHRNCNLIVTDQTVVDPRLMICTMATMTGLVDFNQTEVDGAGLSAAAAADRLRSELRSYVANVYRYHRQYIYDVVLYQYRQDKLPPADRNHRHFSDTLVAILGDAQQVNSLASGDLSV